MSAPPVDGHTRQPEPADRGGERFVFVRVLGDGVDDFVARGPGRMLQRELGQHLAGAGFEQCAGFFVGEEPAHAVGEAHRGAQMARPVLRVGGLRGGHPVAGDAGDDRQLRRVQAHRAHGFGERRDRRLDHRRMKGVRGGEAAARDVALAQFGFENPDGVLRSREHAEFVRIDRGQREAFVVEKLARLLLAEARGEHRSARQILRQPGSDGDEVRGVFEREDAGQRGGDKLADAVAEQRRGSHAERHPEPGERVAGGKDGRLGEACFAEPRRRVFVRGEKQRAQIEAEFGAENSGAFIERGAERGFARVELRAHLRILRALAGEKKRDGGFGAVFGALKLRRPTERGDGAGGGPGEDGAAMLEKTTPGLQREGDRGERLPGMRLKMGGEIARPPFQRGGGFGGENEELWRAAFWRGRKLRRFFEDGVGIRPADAEGTHPGAARRLAARPRA